MRKIGRDSTCIPMPRMTREQFNKTTLSVGFQCGLIKAVDDVAYEKSTRRKRTLIVPTTAQERDQWKNLK